MRHSPRPDPAWLRDGAWPLWLEHGLDRARGGFHEHLHPATLACDAEFRRLRVAARQIYVFSAAHRHGFRGADEAVEMGIAFLRRHARQPEGGYAWRFDLDGRVLDARRDLYDHAFVLLALASATAVLPAAPLREEALALLSFLDDRMRHPAGGWLEGLPHAPPRRQNPHMHLLEALLAAHGAFGDELFLDRAREVVALFLGRLFDARAGALPEFFTEDLAPLTEDGRFAVEPGHHHEWAWLLDRFARVAGRDERTEAAAARLIAFAEAHGVHPELGTAMDTVWSDGAPRDRSCRLWPQTERLKALVLARGEAGRAAAEPALSRYLLPDPPGLWHERLRPDGSPVEEPAPASSLYHLTCAILAAAEG